VTGWAAVGGAPRADSTTAGTGTGTGTGTRGAIAAGTTAGGVLHMPPQALLSYPPIATLANALLAALNGLRLLAPAALLFDLANALDASLAKALGTLLEAGASRTTTTTTTTTVEEEARGAAMAFWRLLVPFVRKGLIEGVYGSNVGDVPPSEALREMVEKMNAWVDI